MHGREKASEQVKALEDELERLREASKLFAPMLIGLIKAAKRYGLEPNDAGVEKVFEHLSAAAQRETYCDGKCIDKIRKAAKKKHGSEVKVESGISIKPKHARFAESNPLFVTYPGKRRKERLAFVGDYCQFCGGRREVPTLKEPDEPEELKALGEAIEKNGRLISDIEKQVDGIASALAGPFG